MRRTQDVKTSHRETADRDAAFLHHAALKPAAASTFCDYNTQHLLYRDIKYKDIKCDNKE